MDDEDFSVAHLDRLWPLVADTPPLILHGNEVYPHDLYMQAPHIHRLVDGRTMCLKRRFSPIPCTQRSEHELPR